MQTDEHLAAVARAQLTQLDKLNHTADELLLAVRRMQSAISDIHTHTTIIMLAAIGIAALAAMQFLFFLFG